MLNKIIDIAIFINIYIVCLVFIFYGVKNGIIKKKIILNPYSKSYFKREESFKIGLIFIIFGLTGIILTTFGIVKFAG